MQLKFPFPSDRDDSFENFIVDGANGAAASILRAFAEGRAGQPASLALHGSAGCGKTHALSAMGALIAVESRIRPLPEKVANQIAAGEVVERPASIIKELVENSIDAGSKSVTVSIRNGGKSFIEVTDDGCGMGRDDALLAFERHATSKIKDENDLHSISTLGFRGEALGSIASVSRMVMSTCQAGEPAGTEVVIEGGRLRDVRQCAPIPGTRTQVKSLFYNVPARRKFLRSESSEAGHAQEALARQALCRPEVGFRFIRDGRPVFDSPGSEGGGFMERIEALFGRRLAGELAPLSFEKYGMRLTGHISRPGLSRGGRDSQYFYVNRRYMKDRLVMASIAEGFRSLIPKGRYPAYFLRLDISPDRVDANVSPTKTEVRFLEPGLVIGFLKEAVAASLRAAKDTARDVFASSAAAFKPQAGPDSLHGSGGGGWLSEPVAAMESEMRDETRIDIGGGEAPAAAPTAPGEPARLMRFDFKLPESPVVVGQVFKSFILIEDGDRLLLLDQHTAHERVNFERLTVRYREGRVDSQELLFPAQMEFSGRDAELLKKSRGLFERLGFVMEEFGERSFNLRAVPALLIGGDYSAVIHDILDKAGETGAGVDFGELAEPAIALMACRASVMAGDLMDKKEIAALVESLKKCSLPYTCPHGRPVALTLEKNDLMKGFFRK